MDNSLIYLPLNVLTTEHVLYLLLLTVEHLLLLYIGFFSLNIDITDTSNIFCFLNLVSEYVSFKFYEYYFKFTVFQ